MRSVAIIVVLALASVAYASTILEIAESLPQFSTLVAVAGQAGIAQLLSAPGLKTVFAPTNDAFGALGNNTLGWITNLHNQQNLLATLYYHISTGAVTTKYLSNGQILTTLDASSPGAPANRLEVSGSAPNFNINNAQITTSDVVASNGVIQVINKVLVPQNIGIPAYDIVHTALAVPQLSTLVKAVIAAGLVPALSQPNGPYTVFAPTDAAFAAVPASILNCLLNNKQALTDVLLFHVAAGFTYSEQLADGTTVTTLAGKPIILNVVGNGVQINYGSGFPASKVVIPNVDTNNGVVHVIDTVLFDNTGPCKTN